MPSKSFVFQMKCEVTSNTTHDVLISKESHKSYKEICSGEPKKVNLGYNNDYRVQKVENNTLIPYPERELYKEEGAFTQSWEVLQKFFSIQNIEPNWLDCNSSWGWYDEDLGGWTGCIGKV